jgi:hypothetical protein
METLKRMLKQARAKAKKRLESSESVQQLKELKGPALLAAAGLLMHSPTFAKLIKAAPGSESVKGKLLLLLKAGLAGASAVQIAKTLKKLKKRKEWDRRGFNFSGPGRPMPYSL